jgi:hypothetical protein
MNQELTNELAEARAQLEAAKTRIERVEAELAKKGNPWEPWKPEVDQAYWAIDVEGGVLDSTWDDDRTDNRRRDFNNCFLTEAAAERHALRLRSMRPTCPVPKVGERCWVAMVDNNSQLAEMWRWQGWAADIFLYNAGRAFATEEAAEAWIAEFGDAWTTLEDWA